jgi:TPR repeat protein
MPATVTTPLLDRDEINAMLGRARNFLSTGDVAAARVVLRRAAASDDPQAALALGGTYDPSVLKKLGIISFHADPAMARDWYRKAAALGSADASLRLEQLVQTDR